MSERDKKLKEDRKKLMERLKKENDERQKIKDQVWYFAVGVVMFRVLFFHLLITFIIIHF